MGGLITNPKAEGNIGPVRVTCPADGELHTKKPSKGMIKRWYIDTWDIEIQRYYDGNVHPSLI